ncbi:MAG: PAS domain S-box protein [Nitrospinales bacterium]
MNKTSEQIKKLENKLLESEERLRILSKLSYDVLWEWDIVSGNHIWIGDIDTCLGYDKNEFPRTIEAWKKIIHPEDQKRVEKNLQEHHKTRVKWDEVYRIIKKNGEIRWWEDRGVTRWGEDGNPLIMTGVILDITEKVLQEQKLIEFQKQKKFESMEKKFFNMLDQLPVCFHLQKNDHTVPFANKMFKERFGSPEKGKCYELMHNREKPCEPCPTFRTFDNHNTETTIWSSPDKKTYMTVTTPFYGAGEELQIMEMSIDISEQKKFEESLAISEKLFKTIFEESPLGIALIESISGKIIQVNAYFSEISGRSKSELKKLTWMDLTHPDDLDKDWQNYKNLNSGKINRYNIQKRYIKPDGKEGWINKTVTKVSEIDNKHMHLAMIEDITEKKKTEEFLAISEKQFRTIFEESPLGVALIDSLNGNIYEVNNKFAEIAGRSLSEMENIDWMSITHPDDVQEDLDNMAALNLGKIKGFNMEKRYIKPNGSYVWINMTISPLTVENKNAPRHLCMIEDITERKTVESELENYKNQLEEKVNKRTEELQSSQERLLHSEKLSSLGKFAGTIAHEFNNPLFGVISLIEQIGEDLGKKERKKFSDLAQKECWRMADMIKNLQSFYQPSEGTFTNISMSQLLDDVLFITAKAAKNKGIEINKNYKNDAYFFDGIEDQIKQVLLNIIQNSIDSISDGGKIILNIAQSSKDIILEIQDTGSGISIENQKFIFDPFFSTKGEEGTGLGLSVSYGIIKKHGGDISMESEASIGSTVTLVLPLKSKK